MKNFKSAILVVLAFWVINSCTAITDFDDPNIIEKVDFAKEVNENLTATLINSTGSINLIFKNPLEKEAATAIAELFKKEITLQIINKSNNIGMVFTTVQTVTPPAAPGEYNIAVSGDYKIVTINFYNQTKTGEKLIAGGNYSALFKITENDYFVSGTFAFTLAVK
jgi:hypothetical protein